MPLRRIRRAALARMCEIPSAIMIETRTERKSKRFTWRGVEKLLCAAHPGFSTPCYDFSRARIWASKTSYTMLLSSMKIAPILAGEA